MAPASASFTPQSKATSSVARASLRTPPFSAAPLETPYSCRVRIVIYLLDTNVISELRKAKPHGAVLAWISGVDNKNLFVPAVVLGELQAGVELTRRQDPTRAQQIEVWLEQLEGTYQILAMDGQAFREWARLMNGQPDELIVDAMVAATARIHNLTLVTRNIRDFKAFNVPLLDPFGWK